jgi:hypothetical protein
MRKVSRSFAAAVVVAGMLVIPTAARAACVDEAPVVVGGTKTPNTVEGKAAAQWQALGVSMNSVAIRTLCATGDRPASVEFDINVDQLDAPPPGEVVRYLWQFNVSDVDGNSKGYQVQAKTSDMLTAATLPDDPQGQLSHSNGSFRLRGNCTTTGATICHHVAWVEGAFDTANHQVRVIVPLGASYAPDFTPGNSINGGATPATAVQAGFQAQLSNAETMESMSQDDEYVIPAL